MRGRPRGQSLVEFAISGLVLVLLLGGAADLGRAFYYAVALQGAAREGARQAGYATDFGVAPANLPPNQVLTVVNRTLAGSGLSATLGTGCPSTTTGNGPYDGHFPDRAGSVLVYVCYQAPGAGTFSGYDPAQNYANGDVDVIVLMSYGLISGWFQGVAPGGFPIAANVHMPVQG